MDQLMSFAWKFMLPMALIKSSSPALWHFSATGNSGRCWSSLGHLRCCLLLAPTYIFGRALQPRLAKRTYRYAE